MDCQERCALIDSPQQKHLCAQKGAECVDNTEAAMVQDVDADDREAWAACTGRDDWGINAHGDMQRNGPNHITLTHPSHAVFLQILSQCAVPIPAQLVRLSDNHVVSYGHAEHFDVDLSHGQATIRYFFGAAEACDAIAGDPNGHAVMCRPDVP